MPLCLSIGRHPKQSRARINRADKLQLINIDFRIDFDQIVKYSNVSNERFAITVKTISTDLLPTKVSTSQSLKTFLFIVTGSCRDRAENHEKTGANRTGPVRWFIIRPTIE